MLHAQCALSHQKNLYRLNAALKFYALIVLTRLLISVPILYGKNSLHQPKSNKMSAIHANSAHPPYDASIARLFSTVWTVMRKYIRGN